MEHRTAHLAPLLDLCLTDCSLLHRKVTRAEKHIHDLEAEIAKYAARRPYTVREVLEGEQKVRSLVFTRDPAIPTSQSLRPM
jgi:hypothetical protein